MFALTKGITASIGGILNFANPPGGKGFCSGKRGPWLIDLCFCTSTSERKFDSAASMLGFTSRRDVLCTAFSRNSLAKAVWEVNPASPPKADSSSLESKSFAEAVVGMPLLPVPGVVVCGWAAPGLRLLFVVRLLRRCSMLPRRDSIWSIFLSLRKVSLGGGISWCCQSRPNRNKGEVDLLL